jgi:hypothetical protein
MWCCQPVTHRGAGGGGRSAGRRTPSRQGGCAGGGDGLERGEVDFLGKQWTAAGLRAACVGNDQIAGNVAGWGISEIMRGLPLWRVVERKRSDAKASRRDARRLPARGTVELDGPVRLEAQLGPSPRGLAQPLVRTGLQGRGPNRIDPLTTTTHTAQSL